MPLMIVPIQRLSKCHQPFLHDVMPWTGHGKSRRHRVIRGRIHRNPRSNPADDTTSKATVAQQAVRRQKKLQRPGVVEKLQCLGNTG